MQRRVDMGAGVLVYPKLEQVELVFGIFELLLPEELLLTEKGREVFVKLVGEVGDAAMAGGKRRRCDPHVRGGKACRGDRGGTEQSAPRQHPLLDRLQDACIAHCQSPLRPIALRPVFLRDECRSETVAAAGQNSRAAEAVNMPSLRRRRVRWTVGASAIMRTTKSLLLQLRNDAIPRLPGRPQTRIIRTNRDVPSGVRTRWSALFFLEM